MKILKYLVLIFLFTIHYSLFTIPVSAATEFTTNFDSTYQVEVSGLTRVTHQIELINNLAHIYTTEYVIQVGGKELQDVQARSGDTKLQTEVTLNDNTTTIKVAVLDPVVGQGKSINFTIMYTTRDIVESSGQIREINVPRLSRANEAKNYVRRVVVPSSFGTPSVLAPEPTHVSYTGDQVTYEYIGFASESLALLFGKSQVYQVELDYKIKNPTLQSADTEIALPPDTSYQRVMLDSLVPEPKEIRLDKDGNWLAIYPLKSQESQNIHAVMYIEVSPTPIYKRVARNTMITKEDKFWETQDPVVVSLASKLTTPQNIYNYLVDNFSYNYTRVEAGAERLGAVRALSDPTAAICTEFTDSFVALARASKIPAREIDGYAVTQNPTLKPLGGEDDVLHAWPEYYDSKTGIWRQVDPTWGNTTGGIDYFHKLDYSHITFVIHGQESQYPHPAGAYKTSPADKTIKVTIPEVIPEFKESYDIVEGNGHKKIINTGKVALSNDLVAYLPPYASSTIERGVVSGVFDRRFELRNLIIMAASAVVLLFLVLLVRLITRHNRP